MTLSGADAKAAPPRSLNRIPDRGDAKALTEAFFSQLGPNLQFRLAIRPDRDRQMRAPRLSRVRHDGVIGALSLLVVSRARMPR